MECHPRKHLSRHNRGPWFSELRQTPLPFERVRAHAWQLVCTITRHVRELGQGVIRGTWITMYEILRRRRRTRRHNCGKNAALPLLSSIKHQLIYERPDRKEANGARRREILHGPVARNQFCSCLDEDL